MMNRREDRDARGMTPRAAPKRGSYADRRMAQLKKEREKYNVNDLGYYNGGVPRKGRGPIRGDALMGPGWFHSPSIHNYMHYNHQDSARVTQEDGIKFKHFMGTDKVDFNRTQPGYPAYYDENHNYRADRDFWLRFGVFMLLGSYALKRWQLEADRSHMTDRMNGFPNTPGHHFNNRGGVLVHKQFTGFMKYFQTLDDQMDWYERVYPDAFN